jgi:hypothetical protein
MTHYQLQYLILLPSSSIKIAVSNGGIEPMKKERRSVEREREREANLEKKERKIKRLLCGFFLVLQMALVPTTNIGREERMRSI